MADIKAIVLPDNNTYNFKDSRVSVPVPTDAVFTDHIYESKTAASGGTAVSLVTTGEKYTWNNKYAKPSGGIPKSDLASAVQTSLEKADSALQSSSLSVASSSASSAQKIPSGGVVDYSINVAKSGKTAIAVIGLYPGYPVTISVRWFRLVYNTQTVECRLWNHHNAELTSNITVTCLYVG